VIEHLNWCIDNYSAVGDFDLSAAVEHLAATVIRVASTSRARERWTFFLNNFVWPFSVNVVAAIPGNALAQLALGRIVANLVNAGSLFDQAGS